MSPGVLDLKSSWTAEIQPWSLLSLRDPRARLSHPTVGLKGEAVSNQRELEPLPAVLPAESQQNNLICYPKALAQPLSCPRPLQEAAGTAGVGGSQLAQSPAGLSQPQDW